MSQEILTAMQALDHVAVVYKRVLVVILPYPNQAQVIILRVNDVELVILSHYVTLSYGNEV
jgi:hypothetical protein